MHQLAEHEKIDYLIKDKLSRCTVEKNMIEKHLDKLIRDNKVMKEDNYFKSV